jgi:hypothetical protein
MMAWTMLGFFARERGIRLGSWLSSPLTLRIEEHKMAGLACHITGG